METADSVAKDILAELLVAGAEQSVESFDFVTAIRYMNRFMAEIDARGISLGYSVVSNPADPITIPLGAINGLIYNTAVNLMSRYDAEIDPLLLAKAKESKKAMRDLAPQVQAASFPDTLPIGSGNEWGSSRFDKFYDEQPDSINAETGAVISPEEGTEV